MRALWTCDKSKIQTLARLASIHNSVAIALTETHISDEIEDSEINIDGWSHFRGDRLNRKCGGTIIYVREGLTVSNETSYSNEYCDMSGVFVSNRNLAIVSIYRPPACPSAKFSDMLSFMNKWLKSVTESYNAPNIYITGDYNLKFLEDWNHELIQSYSDTVVCRLSEDAVIADEKLQAQELILFSES